MFKFNFRSKLSNHWGVPQSVRSDTRSSSSYDYGLNVLTNQHTWRQANSGISAFNRTGPQQGGPVQTGPIYRPSSPLPQVTVTAKKPDTPAGHYVKLSNGPMYHNKKELFAAAMVSDRVLMLIKNEGPPELLGEYFDYTRNVSEGWKVAAFAIGAPLALIAGAELGGGYLVFGMSANEAALINRAYSEATFKSFQRQLQQHGVKSLQRSQNKIQRRLSEHLKKLEEINRNGGYPSSVEREIRVFREQLKAIEDLLK